MINVAEKFIYSVGGYNSTKRYLNNV